MIRANQWERGDVSCGHVKYCLHWHCQFQGKEVIEKFNEPAGGIATTHKEAAKFSKIIAIRGGTEHRELAHSSWERELFLSILPGWWAISESCQENAFIESQNFSPRVNTMNHLNSRAGVGEDVGSWSQFSTVSVELASSQPLWMEAKWSTLWVLSSPELTF